MSVTLNEPRAMKMNQSDDPPDIWESLLILAQMSKDINIKHSLQLNKRSSISATVGQEGSGKIKYLQISHMMSQTHSDWPKFSSDTKTHIWSWISRLVNPTTQMSLRESVLGDLKWASLSFLSLSPLITLAGFKSTDGHLFTHTDTFTHKPNEWTHLVSNPTYMRSLGSLRLKRTECVFNNCSLFCSDDNDDSC